MALRRASRTRVVVTQFEVTSSTIVSFQTPYVATETVATARQNSTERPIELDPYRKVLIDKAKTKPEMLEKPGFVVEVQI